jgi:hypothetical protein
MIAYVEQVHRLDPAWRGKATSKALAQVLGEHSTMTCDNNAADSDDEENDRLFQQSRGKSLEELDQEHHQRTKERKLKEQEEKQKQLRSKFMKNDKNEQNNTNNNSPTNDPQQSKPKQESQMGPVFSSLKTDQIDQQDDQSTTESTTITISENENNINDNNNRESNTTTETNQESKEQLEQTNSNVDNDLEIQQQPEEDQSQQQDQPKQVVNNDAHCMYSNETYIRLCAGHNFSDLTELDDLLVFQNFIEDENILAVTAKHADINPEQLKDNQDELFSYKVILVDSKRVTLLHQVAETGTSAQCGIILHTFHYPIDLPNASGSTPLMLAIGNENFDMVKYLVSQGANLLYTQPDGTTVEDLIDLCDNTQLQQYLQDQIAKAKETQKE